MVQETLGNRFIIALILVSTAGIIFGMTHICAFNGRDLAILNTAVPIIQAGWRAHRNGNPVGKAIFQAAAGGFMMQRAFEMAAEVDENTTWKAWQAKLLLNLGASLAESAGKKLIFRMDIGPVWVFLEDGHFSYKFGIQGFFVPWVNNLDGAKIDLGRSLKFGTIAMQRNQRADGTISSNGALAYSNANNFITNPKGSHVGHELVHTFQYRRDAFSSPKISNLIPSVQNWIPHNWVDDTGWSVDWGAQCLWAKIKGEDKDFNILMEKEAYYLTRKRID